MAQFKSAAREGSFSSRQLVDPNAVQKIQQQGIEKVRAMQNAQSFLEQNERISLQAQQQAQGLENKNRSTISNIKVDNLKQQKNYIEESYERELIKKQNKDKFKVDLLSNLIGWAPSALKLAEGIVKQNNELQQKAINQNSFTHNLTHKDVLAAKSVDSSISNSQWQETEQVQQMQRDGKSQ